MCVAQLELETHTHTQKETTELLSWDSKVAVKLAWLFFFHLKKLFTWINSTVFANKQTTFKQQQNKQK